MTVRRALPHLRCLRQPNHPSRQRGYAVHPTCHLPFQAAVIEYGSLERQVSNDRSHTATADDAPILPIGSP
jgi:hypothetical protein